MLTLIHINEESQRQVRNVSYPYWECPDFLRFFNKDVYIKLYEEFQ